MKSKTIFLFTFGLISWLFATNYQAVHSKMADVFNLASGKVEKVFDKEKSTNELVASIAEKDLVEVDTFKERSLTNEVVTETIADKVKEESEEVTAVKTELETNINTDAAESQIASLDSNIPLEESDAVSEQIEPATTKTTNNITTAKPSNTALPMNMGFPMPSTNMMNPSMYMNPMAMMAPMMMSMMGPMMNPYLMMNPMAMMNHPINSMTHPQNMNAMMMSMNPEMMFGMFGQPSQAYKNGEVPDQLPVVKIPGFPTQTYQSWPKNKVTPATPREAKHNAFQTAMAMSPLSMRSMVSMMADKIPVDEGVSWDDAVEAMKLRANEVNFKFVGSSPLWKQIEAETEQPSAKVEMFRFCDARMARKILDEVPEFIVFLPCKIALLEDAEGKLWVMTLDWDVSWMDYAQNPNNHLSKDIREHAKLIRENIQYIMEGAATGDF